MKAWRLASGRYDPLTGEGARRVGGRWNSPGRPVVYCSESLALALVECLVHVPGKLPKDYTAFQISLPHNGIQDLESERLPEGWQHDVGLTRSLGDEWLAEENTPVLRVPSAVLPASRNLLLHPLHPRFEEIEVVGRQPFRFDPRLRSFP